MLSEFINIINSFFFRLKNFFIFKRNYILIIVIFLLVRYNVKLISHLRNLQSVIIYSTNLCFLPTWRDDFNNSDTSCFGKCCTTSNFNLNEDFNCIITCNPSLVSHYKSCNTFFTFLPVKIFPQKKKKIISFSLYGSESRYLHNVFQVIRKFDKLLSGWIPRFYVGSDVPPLLINRLIYKGAEVIVVYQNQPSNSRGYTKPPNYHGMFWRFFVSEDTNVQRYLIRDADSLPIQREIDAINEWVSEKTMFHVMRDHEQHATEILGGMWGGVVNRTSFNFHLLYEKALADGYGVQDGYWLDQFFLKTYIWPIVRHNMTCHVSYHWLFISDKGCKDFPTKRINDEFIGSVILD